LVKQLSEFIQAFDDDASMVLSNVKFTFHGHHDHILMGVTYVKPELKQFVDHTLKQFELSEGHENNEVSAKFGFELGLKNDLLTMFRNAQDEKNKGKKFLQEVVEGFRLHVHLGIHSENLKEIRNEYFSELSKLEKEFPLLGIVIFGMLKNSKAELRLHEFDAQGLLNIITKVGSGASFKKTPSFRDLLEFGKKKGVLNQVVEGLPVMADLAELFKGNMRADVVVMGFVPHFSVEVKVSTHGVKETWEYLMGK